MYCLRMGDLESICWALPLNYLPFGMRKCNCQFTSFSLSPFLERWRAHICTLWWLYHHFSLVFPGAQKLPLYYLGELLRDTDNAGLQWHCHKRMGAATFMAHGGSTRGLRPWARRRSPQIAGHYCVLPPPTWTLPPTPHAPA